MTTLIEIVTALAAVEEAANAYQALTAAAGYGYRNADDDVRLLGWLSDHEEELKVAPSKAFELALVAHESASPYDDGGYIYQGVEDELNDVAERIGVKLPYCEEHDEYHICPHAARPSDNPDGAVVCKVCGEGATWVGPGMSDWAHADG